MSKKLVAYFSAQGSTAKLAKTLAAAAGAELYEIRPAVPYERRDRHADLHACDAVCV